MSQAVSKDKQHHQKDCKLLCMFVMFTPIFVMFTPVPNLDRSYVECLCTKYGALHSENSQIEPTLG